MEARKVSIKDNYIFENEGDGIELREDSEGIIEDNDIKENDGVGLRLTIDETEMYVKDNTFRDNDKSGMEVRAKGKEGLVRLSDENKFYKNEEYGIVRIEKEPFCADQWNRSFIVENDTIFWENEISPYSHIIKVY
jgi:parallel beta-helix repeat protein